ncbi:hypothetical protein HK100_006591, partial [Physocladia obscura]
MSPDAAHSQHNRDSVNLHAKGIAAIDHSLLTQLSFATTVDLSANSIDSMQPLFYATNLVELNLAANEIHTIEGLGNMPNLLRLILSFNLISSLRGIAEISSTRFYYLDLKGNLIEDFSQLYYLAGLKSLKSLVLQDEENSSSLVNPICKNMNYSTRIFEILPFLNSLDDPVLRYFPDMEEKYFLFDNNYT